MNNLQSISYALLGGVVPALLWLFFWLREDAKRPEPKGRIAETFLLGMLTVILVLPFQKMVAGFFPGLGLIAFTLWAVLEEGFKFSAAYAAAIRTTDDDEPIDMLIYMITAALGFVALENALFIWNPLLQFDLIGALSTGSMRFVGASLLHVVSSGALGLMMALAFYGSWAKKMAYGLIGLVLAVVIHTTFNMFILRQDSSQSLQTFAAVWFGAALLLLFFEKVKTIAPEKGQDII